jgi:hypothetical protein
MLADIGAPGQDTVELADAPTPAVARVDAALVEIVHDRLHAHRAAVAVSLRCQPEDQTYGVGMQRVDLQLLLDLCPALFCRDRTIADRRQGAVPEALPGILLERAQNVLGVSLDRYSSNSAMICRIMTCMGSSPISCVIALPA